MSYLVLARKWRPKKFEELVGQEHVVRALSNGLDSGRIHHAFLFTGTRGVGKTTIARLLAKALNCDKGVSANPCGVCGTCKEIEEGRFVDLIEVDAASRTKVEDTRELLENVQYAPSRGRYKVYLIDEVHMLSGHSFNALLKTLEEPPPHVKFLLATTDPQKLPVTVVSRCLQFHLKRLSPNLIVGRLGHILETEQIHSEPQALELLAQGADGSLRDALSLLDQALVYGAGQVLEADVRRMLGTIDRTHVLALLNALAAADAVALLDVINAMEPQAPDYHQVLGECAEAILRLTREQWVPGTGFEDYGDKKPWIELSAQVPAEELQLWYQILLMGRRDLSLALNPRSGFEMTLLRCLAFKPTLDPHSAGGGVGSGNSATRSAPLPKVNPEAKSSSASARKVSGLGMPVKTPTDAQRLAGEGDPVNLNSANDAHIPVKPATTSRLNVVPKPELRPESMGSLVGTSLAQSATSVMPEEWRDVALFPEWVKKLKCTGAVQALLTHCALNEASERHLHLSLDAKGLSFLTQERVAELEALICKQTRLSIKLKIDAKAATAAINSHSAHIEATTTARSSTLAASKEQQALESKSQAQQAFLSDPAVKSLKARFQAEIKMESVQPIKRRGQS